MLYVFYMKSYYMIIVYSDMTYILEHIIFNNHLLILTKYRDINFKNPIITKI